MPHVEEQWKSPCMATANDKNKGDARWQAQCSKLLEPTIVTFCLYDKDDCSSTTLLIIVAFFLKKNAWLLD